MTGAFAVSSSASDARASAPSARRGQLAQFLQEILTAVTRFRTGRQIPKDADSFRSHVKTLLLSADEDARRAGYASADVKYALYAVVAYLDETVLNSGQPAFDSWAKHPMQLDMFGKQVAGEAVFQYLNQLLTRDDSEDLADILEVYLLCLLLGFRGRFASAEQDALDITTTRVRERVARIRGSAGDLAPGWAPPPTPAVQRGADVVLRRLTWGTIGVVVLAILLFVIYLIVVKSNLPQTTVDLSRPTSGGVSSDVTVLI